MDKFFGNSLTQKYINSILYNTEIPLVDFVTENDFIIKDEIYIYNFQFIQCTSTGYLNTKIYTANGNNIVLKYDVAKYNVLGIYQPWRHYNKYTQTFTNIDGFYSSSIHRKLGDYLRAFKFNNYTNLMGMYNCHSLISANNIKVGNYDIKNYKIIRRLCNEENNERHVIIVPIKYGKTYTINLESKTPFVIAPIIYYDNKLARAFEGDEADESELQPGQKPIEDNITNVYFKNYIKSMPMATFNNPFKFKLDLADIDVREEKLKKLYDRQKDLYLMIDLVKANNSTIVVLEGDYTSYKTLDYEIHPSDSEELVFSPILQMYQMNQQVPYSKNLIQYLLSSAIYSSEENDYNVRKLREKLGLDPRGGYDDEVRNIVFQKTLQSLTSFKGDIYGYVDCNAEAIL